jgi:hypothetical protein
MQDTGTYAYVAVGQGVDKVITGSFEATVSNAGFVSDDKAMTSVKRALSMELSCPLWYVELTAAMVRRRLDTDGMENQTIRRLQLAVTIHYTATIPAAETTFFTLVAMTQAYSLETEKLTETLQSELTAASSEYTISVTSITPAQLDGVIITPSLLAGGDVANSSSAASMAVVPSTSAAQSLRPHRSIQLTQIAITALASFCYATL